MQCCTGCGPPTGDLQTIQLLTKQELRVAPTRTFLDKRAFSSCPLLKNTANIHYEDKMSEGSRMA